MAINIRLCVCTADDRTLDKSDYISAGMTVPAQIKAGCSIIDPVFVIAASKITPQLNYIGCSAWSRWYFVRNIVYDTGATAEIHCHVDVLHSYHAQIQALQCTVVRQQSDLQPLIHDSRYTIQANRQCQTIAFDRTPFSANYASDRVYVLTVLGGIDTRSSS